MFESSFSSIIRCTYKMILCNSISDDTAGSYNRTSLRSVSTKMHNEDWLSFDFAVKYELQHTITLYHVKLRLIGKVPASVHIELFARETFWSPRYSPSSPTWIYASCGTIVVTRLTTTNVEFRYKYLLEVQLIVLFLFLKFTFKVQMKCELGFYYVTHIIKNDKPRYNWLPDRSIVQKKDPLLYPSIQPEQQTVFLPLGYQTMAHNSEKVKF